MDALEEWRPISGFPGYEISSAGNLRRTFRCRWKNHGEKRQLRPKVSTTGYLQVQLSIGGRVTTRTIHSLVAAAFLGDRPPKAQVNHKNGNKADARVENLEYCSASGNASHAYATGLNQHARGERWHAAKLRDDDVRAIRLRRANAESLASLSHAFGVATSTLSMICNHKVWTHIK